MMKYHHSLHSSFTTKFPNHSYLAYFFRKKEDTSEADVVERPPRNSYSKRFVIFQVVLPCHLKYLLFAIMQIMQILATLVCEFLFLSAGTYIDPDFLFHILVVVGPNFITVFISI